MRGFSWLGRRDFMEGLLLLAVLGYIARDLCTSAPAPLPTVELKLQPGIPDAAAKGSQSPRTEPRLARISATSADVNTTFTVCGSSTAPENPWIIGKFQHTQALVIQLGEGCAVPPSVTTVSHFLNGSAVLAGIQVLSGSLLQIRGIQPNVSVRTGQLSLASGSHLELEFATTLSPDAYSTVTYSVLAADGSCPPFGNVSLSIGCPNDTSLAMVGSYVCAAGSITRTSPNGDPECGLTLTVIGALTVQAGVYLTIMFNKDCSVFTLAMFIATVQATTGVPGAALIFPAGGWRCGSISSSFTVAGSSQAQASAALAVVQQSALSGALLQALGVTSVTLGQQPSLLPYYPYQPYYDYGSTSWRRPSSSSNPALFGLLALLAIPVFAIAAAVVWCRLRRREKDPALPPMCEYKPQEAVPPRLIPPPPRAVPALPVPAAPQVRVFSREPSPMYTPSPSPAGGSGSGGTVGGQVFC